MQRSTLCPDATTEGKIGLVKAVIIASTRGDEAIVLTEFNHHGRLLRAVA
jgi:hypothetical protein